jgi:hypothetical protein
MTQSQLQALHNMAWTRLELYINGLITLPELVKAMAEVGEAIGETDNLLDPNTGLRL